MKKCSKCGIEKDDIYFPFQNKESNILMSACKECRNKAQREYRKNNPLDAKKKDRKQYEKHKDKRVLYAREYRKNNPEKTMESNLKKKYGIDIKQYKAMLKNQNSRCAICGKHQKKHSRNFSVDHNHKTGKVRALLCDGCNYGVGFLEKYKEKYEIYLSKYN